MPGSDSSINIAGYCDKAEQAKMNTAITTAQTDQTAANAQWAQVDKDIMTASAVARLITPKHVDFLSKRVGNYEWVQAVPNDPQPGLGSVTSDVTRD